MDNLIKPPVDECARRNFEAGRAALHSMLPGSPAALPSPFKEEASPLVITGSRGESPIVKLNMYIMAAEAAALRAGVDPADRETMATVYHLPESGYFWAWNDGFYHAYQELFMQVFQPHQLQRYRAPSLN